MSAAAEVDAMPICFASFACRGEVQRRRFAKVVSLDEPEVQSLESGAAMLECVAGERSERSDHYRSTTRKSCSGGEGADWVEQAVHVHDIICLSRLAHPTHERGRN
jgi:hypothetical protein